MKNISKILKIRAGREVDGEVLQEVKREFIV